MLSQIPLKYINEGGSSRVLFHQDQNRLAKINHNMTFCQKLVMLDWEHTPCKQKRQQLVDVDIEIQLVKICYFANE